MTIDSGNHLSHGGYKYDEKAGNIVAGVIKGDNSLVLKLCFKQQFTVTCKPGTYGEFVEKLFSGLDYNQDTPLFDGRTIAKGNYRFNGWLLCFTSCKILLILKKH